MAGTNGGHVEMEIAGFGSARLVCHRTAGGDLVAIGAHAGLRDGLDRIRASHHRWARLSAAGQAARALPDDFYDSLRQASGNLLPNEVRPRNGAPRVPYRERAFDHVAFALSGEDPYKALRRLEHEMRGDFDRGIYDAFAAAMDGVQELMWTPATLEAAARRLADASPGPATLLRRMSAVHRGEPEPADQSLPADDGDEANPRAVIGSVLVSPGEGRWYAHAPRPVEVTVVVECHPLSFEFAGDGSIEGGLVDLEVHVDPATWGPDDGYLYGDEATSEAVIGLLASRGIAGFDPAWSEMGRQRSAVGDMDVDAGIAEAIWPDLVARLRAGAGVGASPT